MEDVDYGAITGIHIGEMFDLFHSNPTDAGKGASVVQDSATWGNWTWQLATTHVYVLYIINLAIKTEKKQQEKKNLSYL